MKRALIGLGIFVIIAIVAIAIYNGATYKEVEVPDNTITITCATGGGKENFLADPEVEQILKEEYGIKVLHVAWSNGKISDKALAEDTGNKYDAVFFSDQRYYEQYQAAQNVTYRKQKGLIALNTPIVFYSWKDVVDVLMKEQIVTQRNGIYYVSNMDKLLQYMNDGARWCDIAPENSNIHSNRNPINVIGVDPVTSSPGATYMGLLAGVLDPTNRTGKITEETISKLQVIYTNSGFLGGTPADLFAQYLRVGAGTYPIIVDYEKSLIDWMVANPKIYDEQIKGKAIILYPEPTTWNSHCIISFTENGSIYLEALEKNERIHEIAFKKYGFRMGVATSSNVFPTSEGDISLDGLPMELYSMLPALRMEGYNTIVDALKETLK